MTAARVFVMAEAGVNHNGDLDLAFRLVDAAAEAGADAVKFQTFRADALTTAKARKAAYQRAKGDDGTGDSQRAMLRRLELDADAHERLAARCRDRGIEFVSTPFDDESAVLLIDRIGVRRIKVSSGDLTNGPFLLRLAASGKPIVLSTGMGTLEEVAEALGVLAFGYTARPGTTPSRVAFGTAFESSEGRRVLQEKATLLHCTSAYPTPMAEVNLRAMDTLRDAFGVPVGYSDHTQGITVPIAAVARGAVLIEKHVTLDRAMPGPDHAASLEPDELAAMVRGIRDAETALGTAEKRPTEIERDTMAVARKSIVAARPIAKGERFTLDCLAVKRPGTGISPMALWDLVGKSAPVDFAPDDEVHP